MASVEDTIVEGEALVSSEPLHFQFDMDRKTGKVIHKGHPLEGTSIAGKVLVLSAAKGGIANLPAIPSLASTGNGPKALIFYRTKPDIVQGALAAGIPIMDRFKDDPTTIIRTGDPVRMDLKRGVVEVGKGKVLMKVEAPIGVKMRLTPEEEDMLAGKQGEVTRWAMEMLVKEGEYWGAEDTAELYSAHVGPSTLYVDEWAFQWLEDLIARGGKFRTLTTTNCIGVDYDRWREIGFDEEVTLKQIRFSGLLNKMGAIPTDTVAPYFLGNMPRMGEHVAWGESNAVVMANSYFGARANLVASHGSIMYGITGRAPRYGFALDEYRRGNVLVELKTSLRHETDFDALGFFVNKTLKRYDRVPVFLNLPREQATITNLKRLSSTLPSGGPSGSLGMFHAVGITPEAKTLEQACQGRVPEDKLYVEDKDIAVCYNAFDYTGKVNMIWLGDASTPQELRHIAELFGGQKVKKGVIAWVFTNAAWVPLLDHMGVSQALKEAGCQLIAGVTPSAFGGRKIYDETLNGAIIACDRAKAAYWADSMGSLTAVFRPVEECVQAAITGRI